MAVEITPLFPGRKGREKYVRVRITGDDGRHTKEIRDEVFPKTRDKTAANIEKQDREQREGEDVRYPNGARLRLPTDHAEGAVNYMRRHVPKGPPAVRTTLMMGAHIKNGRVIHDDEEEE